MSTRILPSQSPSHPAFQTGLSGKARLLFPQHVADWEGCTRCPLGAGATLHVLTRGSLPCDILFIGEAPGPSEDIVGKPFVGRSGTVLDALLNETPPTLNFRHCVTNVLACYPQDTSKLPKRAFREPRLVEAAACRPRLMQIIGMAQPKGVVLLGKISQSFAPSAFPLIPKFLTANLWHPSYILRNGGVNSEAYKEWRDEYLLFLKDVKTHAKKA